MSLSKNLYYVKHMSSSNGAPQSANYIDGKYYCLELDDHSTGYIMVYFFKNNYNKMYGWSIGRLDLFTPLKI